MEFLQVYFAVRREGRKPLFIDGFGDFPIQFPFVFDVVDHPSPFPLAKDHRIEHHSYNRFDSGGVTFDFKFMNHEPAGGKIHRQFICGADLSEALLHHDHIVRTRKQRGCDSALAEARYRIRHRSGLGKYDSFRVDPFGFEKHPSDKML